MNQIKDLQKLLKLLRAHGVVEFKQDGLELKFGSLPTESRQITTAGYAQTILPGGIDESVPVPAPELTEEQLLFFSSDSVEQVS